MRCDVETLLVVLDKLKKEEPLLNEKEIKEGIERIREEVDNIMKRRRQKKINEILE